MRTEFRAPSEVRIMVSGFGEILHVYSDEEDPVVDMHNLGHDPSCIMTLREYLDGLTLLSDVFKTLTGT